VFFSAPQIQQGEVMAVATHDAAIEYQRYVTGMSFGEIGLFNRHKTYEATYKVRSRECSLLSISMKKLARFLANDLEATIQSSVLDAFQSARNRRRARAKQKKAPHVKHLYKLANDRLEKLNQRRKLAGGSADRASLFGATMQVGLIT
jgi:CRP-like cAMP-binding protein